jgi:threonyl-tRNA synthetase
MDASVAPVPGPDLDRMRHSCSHVLAAAVLKLHPDAKLGVGPATDSGFYYDIETPVPLTTEDLPKIEAEMRKIRERKVPFARREVPIGEAAAFMESTGQSYKVELLEMLRTRGSTAAKGLEDPNLVEAGSAGVSSVSLYQLGDFTDLCRGPHVEHSGQVGAFRLTKLAGAYWRGDSRNPQLTRVYGTCWANEADLKAYLHRLEEAEKRDHRKLGAAMQLFHLQEEAPGAIFWHPKGWTLFRTIERYMRTRLDADGYVEVKTPQLVDRVFWEKSGHWENYRDAMFVATPGKEGEEVDRLYAIKPMNCPGAVQIFRQGQRSYRELPLRLAEFGACHRYEPSGALHGIMRVRAFTQDDAHIFCTEDQIPDESKRFCDLLRSIYADFGFKDLLVKFSDRPEKRAGADDIWDKAEQALEKGSTAAGLATTRNPGEGAFYGPKLEFVLRDAIGRDWQCGTLQVDFVLPERLDASYIGEDGAKHRPVMLHRAILGSFERFIGILIESYAGRLPTWLSPIQARMVPIADRHADFARDVARRLAAAELPQTDGGIRVDVDDSTERMQKKIRNAQLEQIPYMLVAGDKEAAEGKVAVRLRSGQDLGAMTVDEVIARIRGEVAARADVPAPPGQTQPQQTPNQAKAP